MMSDVSSIKKDEFTEFQNAEATASSPSQQCSQLPLALPVNKNCLLVNTKQNTITETVNGISSRIGQHLCSLHIIYLYIYICVCVCVCVYVHVGVLL